MLQAQCILISLMVLDRKSTRLNSSHGYISYAVFCLKKKRHSGATIYMSALICGSFAFDNIMVFPDHFKNHILPEKVHILNVSFMVPELRREFGGCAGNIVYNLKLLGSDAMPMGTVGKDFGPYAYWMNKHKINRQHV